MSKPPKKRPASGASKKKRTPYKQGFGARVRGSREEAGFKKRPDFAAAVGVQVRRLQRWEDGDNLPRDNDRQIIERIAALVGRTVVWLESGEETTLPNLPEVDEYLRSRPVEAAAAIVLRKMPWPDIVSHPTVKDLDEWRVMLEVWLRARQQPTDGDSGA